MQQAQQQQTDTLVAAAIEAAETRSAAEIAVAIVPRADRYRLTAVLAAITLFAVVELALGWLPLAMPGWAAPSAAGPIVGPIAGIVLAVLLFVACEHSLLGILLTPAAQRRQACMTRARLLFLDHGIDATQDRLGLLICVCEAERQIEILPDRGIAAVIPAENWQVLIAQFRSQKSAQTLDSALAGLISAVADELAPRFPPWPGQSNDLPDRPFRV
jgi:putative membrane protein